MIAAFKNKPAKAPYIIANPIYDTVFKKLMEDRVVAAFFIETLIGEKVEDVALIPQEYTYNTKLKVRKKKNIDEENKRENTDITETISEDKNQENANAETKEEKFSIIRYDFVATIRTENNEHKKVLIELQKSRKPADLIRFRTYTGELYKRVDVVNVDNGKIEKALPIICIYLLGFTVPNFGSQAFNSKRSYWDMIEGTEIVARNEFIEALMHDGFFVQIPYIQRKNKQKKENLEDLLSIFEQKNFVDKEITKEYNQPINNEIVREMIDILTFVAADPKERRQLEEEYFAQLDEEGYEKALKDLAQAAQDLAQTTQDLAQANQDIVQKDQVIVQKDQVIVQKDQVIAQKDQDLAQKDINFVNNTYKAGLSVEDIAKYTNLTTQQVINIINHDTKTT